LKLRFLDWQRNWNQFVEKFARKDGNGKIYLIPDEFKKWLNILVIEKLNSLAEVKICFFWFFEFKFIHHLTDYNPVVTIL